MKNNLNNDLAITLNLKSEENDKFNLPTPISKAMEEIKNKVKEVNTKITDAEIVYKLCQYEY